MHEGGEKPFRSDTNIFHPPVFLGGANLRPLMESGWRVLICEREI